MKKALCLLLIGAVFYPCSFKANNEYSEWSMEYPNIDNINIKTEERYLYYKLDEENVEYKKYDPNSKKFIDLDDYKYQFSYSTYDEVPETEHTRVTTRIIPVDAADESVKYIRIKNYGYEEKKIELLGISFQDARTYRDVHFSLNDMVDSIKEEENENSFWINKDGYVKFELNNTFEKGMFLQINFILMGHNTTQTKDFVVDYLDSNENVNYTVHLQSYIGDNIVFNTYPDDKILWESKTNIDKLTEYTVEDKLYKYYDLVRTDIGYYTNLEGNYFKDPDPITFYSYQIKEDDNNLNNESNSSENEDLTDDEEPTPKTNTLNIIDNDGLDENELKEKNQKKESDKKETKKKSQSTNLVIEPTYEYLDNYPLDISSNDDELDLYEENEEYNDEIDTTNLIAFKTDDKDNNKHDVFKVYGILSISGLLILLLILIIYKALKKEKNI